MLGFIYRGTARKYNFVKLPIAMFTDEAFKNLSNDSKILYALLLDRVGFSVKRKWFDEEGRVYVKFPVNEICAALHIGNQKAAKLMRELRSFGLLEKVRCGMGRPDKIFVKIAQEDESVPESVETGDEIIADTRESAAEECHRAEADRSEKLERRVSDKRRRDISEMLRINLECNRLAADHKRDNPLIAEQLEAAVAVMTDCIVSTARTIRVNGEDIPAQTVKDAFLKLRRRHIEPALDRLKMCGQIKVINPRAYLITTLYNAFLIQTEPVGSPARKTSGRKRRARWSSSSLKSFTSEDLQAILDLA